MIDNFFYRQEHHMRKVWHLYTLTKDKFQKELNKIQGLKIYGVNSKEGLEFLKHINQPM